MKVLIHTYNTCFQNVAGGMQSRVMTYKEHLEKCPNIHVDFFAPQMSKILDYDVLHLFRLDIENYALTEFAKKAGLKIILSSVVPICGGEKIDILRLISFLPIMTTYKMEKAQFDAADWIVVESFREQTFIHKHYKVNLNKIVVIPNGVDYQPPYNGKDIFSLLGFEDDYILSVGRIDPNKNQLNLIKALKNTGIQLVIIGGPDNNSKAYYQKCLEESKNSKNIHMLGWIDNNSNVLKSAYANCKMFVLPSIRETFGITILEAVSFGANIAISDTLPILDYNVFDSVARFNPRRIESIRECICNNMDCGMSYNDREKILKEFSWKQVIQKYINCYNKTT